MARGTLHAPKPDGERRRRNSPSHGEHVLTDDDEIRGPELVGPFTEPTLAWYATWRRAPQAQLFQDTDSSRHALLAPIVEAYFRRPSTAAPSEIRMNEERLGATVVDRMRTRSRITDPEPEGTPTARGSNVTLISASRASIHARPAAAPDPAPF